jgi:hypothetical protein
VGHQKKIRLTLVALAISVGCMAQRNVAVQGIVADSSNLKPLPFVNIIIKKTYHGTSSDKNGYFSIVAEPTDTLQFSFVGYKTLEFPVAGWEPSVILMPEEIIILNNVIIKGAPIADPYEHLFDEENLKLQKSKKPPPFYYSREKKEKVALARAKQESIRVKHYVDLIIKDEKVKAELMRRHKLSEQEYYDLLAKFNEKNYSIMYYLSDSELLSLLYRFYDVNTSR